MNMKNLYKRWLTPPSNINKEDIIRFNLLNMITLSAILFVTIIIIGITWGGETFRNIRIIDFVFLGVYILLQVLLHKGWIRFVSIMTIASGLLFFTLAVAVLGTIRTPTTSAFLIFVIIAGVLFEKKGVLISIGVSSFTVLALILAENNGLLPAPNYTVNITQWVTFTAFFCLTGALMIGSHNTTQVALEVSKKEIKQREQVEIELRKLTQAVEQSPVSIIITDIAGNIEYVNPRFSSITGYSMDEIRGKTSRILRTGHTPAAEYEILWKTILEGNVWNGEFLNRKKNGETYWEKASISSIRDENGEIKYFLGVKEDITAIKTSQAALLASEERYRRLVENSPDILYRYSEQRGGIYFSPSVEHILGYTPAEMVAQPMIWHNSIHPDDLHASGQSPDVLSPSANFVQEYRIVDRQGRWHWLYERCIGTVIENSEVIIEGLVTDITEHKNSEAALLAAQSDLEQHVQARTIELQTANIALGKALRSRVEFLAAMSHELRTPLTGILGLSQVLQLQTYGPQTEKQLIALGNIEKSGQHLLEVINEILDYSKLQSGTLLLDLRPYSLKEICKTALKMTAKSSLRKHQNTSLSLQPEEIIIRVDVLRIRQVLLNLLSNASKFTPEGGNFGIEVLGNRDLEQIRITVWDEGIGINAEDQTHLFQPFVQLDASLSRQYNGTGLGLALAKNLLDLLGGIIDVESTPGKGSRFIITLPWAEE